ncbi:glycosyl transferase [Bdellovibrio sp. qaytius]|nr:glycosyl transferase [Bdellovibrio sp. qaytius]
MIKNDLIAFSQTRWGFIYQRTQQLLSRYAKHRRVFFIEEPIFTDTIQISYRKVFVENGVEVIKPVLPNGLSVSEVSESMRRVVDDLIEDEFIINFSTWYDYASAMDYSRHLSPISTIYDCVQETNPEKPSELSIYEIELLEKADLVFAANERIYSHRKNQHHNIHNYPNSIDLSHFRQARRVSEPLDQRKITGPKLGFCGEITNQINFDLLTDMADYRPSWNFILVGPMVGCTYNDLPHRPNIYYFGRKDYKYLPHYFAGWDVTIAPYKLDKCTNTTTQMYEYLATGRPVVATPQELLLEKYEPLGLVKTASSATCFLAACEEAMQSKQDSEWLKKVDEYLDSKSWDQTFEDMKALEIKTLMSSMPYRRNKMSNETMMSF